jgi:hypothetical protein
MVTDHQEKSVMMRWRSISRAGVWATLILMALATTLPVVALALLAPVHPPAREVAASLGMAGWSVALLLAAAPWWALLSMCVEADLRSAWRNSFAARTRLEARRAKLSVSAASAEPLEDVGSMRANGGLAGGGSLG